MQTKRCLQDLDHKVWGQALLLGLDYKWSPNHRTPSCDFAHDSLPHHAQLSHWRQNRRMIIQPSITGTSGFTAWRYCINYCNGCCWAIMHAQQRSYSLPSLQFAIGKWALILQKIFPAWRNIIILRLQTPIFRLMYEVSHLSFTLMAFLSRTRL